MEYALITGATSGIGYALAECFAKDGIGLVLVSSNMKHLKQAKEKLEAKYDTQIAVYEKDLSVPEAADELYPEIKEKSLPISYLVNNAGFGLIGATDTIDLKQDERMLTLNMLAPVKLIKLFLPDMEQRGRGHILNVASVGAFQPGPYNSTYYASKGFLYSYSRAIRVELKDKGIAVSTLCPGTTGTRFFERAGAKTPAFAMSPEKVAQIAYRGMKKGKDVIVPGVVNRLLRPVPVGIKMAAVAKMKRKQAGDTWMSEQRSRRKTSERK